MGDEQRRQRRQPSSPLPRIVELRLRRDTAPPHDPTCRPPPSRSLSPPRPPASWRRFAAHTCCTRLHWRFRSAQRPTPVFPTDWPRLGSCAHWPKNCLRTMGASRRGLRAQDQGRTEAAVAAAALPPVFPRARPLPACSRLWPSRPSSRSRAIHPAPHRSASSRVRSSTSPRVDPASRDHCRRRTPRRWRLLAF